MIKVELKMEDVVREGNPTLREVAKDVPTPLLEEDITTLKKMLNFVLASQIPELSVKYKLRPAVGIAAPQLGISKRMIAMSFPDGKGGSLNYALFNAHIVERSEELIYLAGGEGCLSVDREVEGIVPRHAKIKVEALNLEGKSISLELTEYLSIVFQHEIDHLDGIMFYDRINREEPLKAPEGSTPL